MIYRLMCWLMSVCPRHWTPKMYEPSGPHSDGYDFICPACIREKQP